MKIKKIISWTLVLSILSLMILTFGSPIPVLAVDESLLTNSSFEADNNSDGIPDGWGSTVFSGSPTGQLVSNEKYDGSKSFVISGSSTQDRRNLGFQVPNLSGAVGKTLKYSVYCKTNNIISSSYGTCVRITFSNASGATIKDLYILGPKGTSDWTKLEFTFTIPYSCNYIWVENFLWLASGDVWWDYANLAYTNDITNGGFEVDNNMDGIPDGWNLASGEYITSSRDSTVKHSGTYSIKNESTSTSSRSSSFQYMDVSDKKGKKYTISVYQKTENISVSNPQHMGTCMRITYRDSNNSISDKIVSGAKGTSDWNKLSIETTVPENAVSMYIELFIWYASGTVWWDDVEMQQCTDNMLDGADFESDLDNNGTSDYWHRSGSSGNPVVSIDTTYKRSGMKSQKITGDSDDDNVYIFQDVYIDPYTVTDKYTVAAWVKTNNLVSSSYGSVMVVNFFDSQSASTGSAVYIPGPKGTVDWTLISKGINLPSGTARMRISLYLWSASGTVWWDCASVNPTGLFSNKDFEENDPASNRPVNWSSNIVSGNPVISTDGNVRFDGVRSLKMTGTLTTDVCSARQTVDLPGGVDNWGYKISIYNKTHNIVSRGNAQGSCLKVSFLNTNGAVISSTKIRGQRGTNDWIQISKYLSVPINAAKMTIEPTLDSASGTVWWDGLEISPVTVIGNPKFVDSDGNGIPDSWSYTHTGSPQVTTDTGYYVKVTGNSLYDIATLSTVIPLSQDYSSGLRFSTYYKTDGLTVNTQIADNAVAGGRVRIEFLDGSGQQTGIPIYVVAARSKTDVITLTKDIIPPSNAAKIRVNLELYKAMGTLWWKEVRIIPYQTDEAVPLIPVWQNGRVTNLGRPVFTAGSPDRNAAKYTIQYSTDPNFSDGTTVTVNDLLVPSYIVPDNMPDGWVYCRGKTTNTSNVTTGYSPTAKLLIHRLLISPNIITPNGDGTNDSAKLEYTLQETATVNLGIYDHNGNIVKNLVTQQLQDSGDKEVEWDGRNNSGIIVPAGEYNAKLTILIDGQGNFNSQQTFSVEPNDTNAFNGLENNDDWSGFYKDMLEMDAQFNYASIDISTGECGFCNQESVAKYQYYASVAYELIFAYHNPDSIYYNSAETLNKAIAVFDRLLSFEVGTTGSFAAQRDQDPNFDRFALAPLGEAFLLLKDHVTSQKRAIWEAFLRRAAEYQMETYKYIDAETAQWSYPGDYPNMDQYYCLILALIGVGLSDSRYTDEAYAFIRNNADEILPDGGLSYIIGTNPAEVYNTYIACWARYYFITNDSYATDLIEQLGDWYKTAFDDSGMTNYGTCNYLKQYWLVFEDPISADVITYFSGDEKAKMVANIRKKIWQLRYPYCRDTNTMVFSASTGICLDPVSVVPQKIDNDYIRKNGAIKGFSGRWDEFSADITAGKSLNTLSTAAVSSPSNIIKPRDSYLANVYFESYYSGWSYMYPVTETTQGKRDAAMQSGTVLQQVTSSGSKIAAQYVKYIPVPAYGYTMQTDASSGYPWNVRQTWIMFKDRLIGLNTMGIKESWNTQVNNGSFVRSRLVFGPDSSDALHTEIVGNDLYGNYNKLGFWLKKESTDAWEFNTNLNRNVEPGNRSTLFSSIQVGIQKKADTATGLVTWGPYNPNNPDQTMSYHSVFFPLDDFASAKAWHDNPDANNISFAEPQTNVHAVLINADDGSGEYYVVIANHNTSAKASSIYVSLPDGNYTLSRFVDDTGIPESTDNIAVSGGTYSLSYSLSADTIATYKITPN